MRALTAQTRGADDLQPILRQLRPYLLSRSGLLNFYHTQVGAAVRRRYLADEAAPPVHRRIAAFFESQESGERRLEELPWQLQRAEEWDRLARVLGEIPVLVGLYDSGRKYELAGYWDALSERNDPVEVYRASLAAAERDGLHGQHLGDILNSIGGYFYDFQPNHGEAEALYRRALDVRRAVWGANHPETAVAINNLATALMNRDEFAGAEQLLRQVIAIREQVLGPEHPDTADSLSNLALLLWARDDDVAEAEQLYGRALAAYEKSIGQQAPKTALCLNNLGQICLEKDNDSTAEAFFRRALHVRESLFGRDHPDVADTLSGLSEVCQRRGDLEAAVALLRRELAIRDRTPGRRYSPVGTDSRLTSLRRLAALLDETGDHLGAEAIFREIFAKQEENLGPDHPGYALSLNNRGLSHYLAGRHEQAEPLYRRALTIWEKCQGSEHPDVALAKNNLAMLHRARAEFAVAESLMREAAELWQRLLPPEDPFVARGWHNLARVLFEKGDPSAAAPFAARAVEMRRRYLGPDHADTQGSEQLTVAIAAQLGA